MPDVEQVYVDAIADVVALRDIAEPGVAGAGLFGPNVMVINDAAGSGGDLPPYMFRPREIGPLVGIRTWGGLEGSGTCRSSSTAAPSPRRRCAGSSRRTR